jgi:DNA-binding response OmpR family regulator
MTRLPEAIQESTSSPLVSKSLPVELGPFTPEDLQALVIGLSGDIFAWKAAGLTWLQSASGGHPYYAKLLLSHVLQAYGANPQAGDEAVFAAALSSALDDPRANQVIPNLFRVHLNAAERELLLFLAQRQAPVSYQELLQAGASWLTTARRLSRRGYLLETDQRFDFRIAFLATWLRNWASYEEECERYSSLRKFLAEPVVLEVDEVAGQIRLSGEAVRVSIQEFHIMLCLARQSGKLVDRDALILDVWKTEDGVNDQMVDTAIFRLRKKLQDHGQYIETIPGQGFTLHRAILIPSQKH